MIVPVPDVVAFRTTLESTGELSVLLATAPQLAGSAIAFSGAPGTLALSVALGLARWAVLPA